MNFRTKLLIFLLLSFSICAVSALSMQNNYPRVYTVKKNDTLWSIAAQYLQHPWEWQKLWQCNPQVHNPHLIYPGDTLRIVKKNGQVCLQRDPGIVKLSPRMRVTEPVHPIPPIPLRLVQPFLTKSQVMPLAQFLKAPYVIGQRSDHLAAAIGDKIFVRGIKNKNTLHYLVMQRQETYYDPNDKSVLGIEARYIASADLQKLTDPAVLKVTSVRSVINSGDRVFAQGNAGFKQQFYPQRPKHKVAVQIIGFLKAVDLGGRFSIVALNYGAHDGAKPGQILTVYRTGALLNDKYAHNEKIQLPEQNIGEVMIFRCFKKVSYALVMQASQSVKQFDMVRNR